MRAPRYRFPNEVRSATRDLAGRMVQQGSVVRTPEELDRYIAETPEAREPLARGGYGDAFHAADLLPLLHVFVVQAGGAAPVDEAAPAPPPSRRWLVPAVLGVALVAVLLGILALG